MKKIFGKHFKVFHRFANRADELIYYVLLFVLFLHVYMYVFFFVCVCKYIFYVCNLFVHVYIECFCVADFKQIVVRISWVWDRLVNLLAHLHYFAILTIIVLFGLCVCFLSLAVLLWLLVLLLWLSILYFVSFTLVYVNSNYS